MAEEGEGKLWQRARNGDHGAFDALQRKLEAPVRRFVVRLLGRQADAVDEVMQDAFLALYRNRSHITSADHLRPFLYRVARNLCYDAHRRRARRPDVPLGESDDQGPLPLEPRPAPDDAVTWGILYSEVQKAIDKLPEPQRQALVLHSQQDLSYEQIAEATATDINTVKSRIFHGRKKLRRILRPDVLEALGIRKE